MNTNSRKLTICIALPGINYVPSSPYILSTLPMISYLEKYFNVFLVYRKVLCHSQFDHLNHKYLTLIKPDQMSEKEKKNQHSYFTPNHYASLVKYKRMINQFARENADKFDLVIEKEWPFLGAFSSAFSRYKVPTIILIEAMYKYRAIYETNYAKRCLSLGLKKFRPYLRQQWCQTVNSVVVETEQMKSVLLERNYFKTNKPIYPVSYGIDPDIFYPRDRNFCRQQLNINQELFVLTYVGSLNRFIQEPGPIIEALGLEQPHNTVLYMVGDGSKRQELENIAKHFKAKVVFVGRLPQKEAALYIGAANLCIAPYNKHLYWGNKFTCASLKVPEYLACGRPVLTIPCERMNFLLGHQKYGFLINNNLDSYREFFKKGTIFETVSLKENALTRDRKNGTLKDQRIVLTWQETAEIYKQIIEETLFNVKLRF